MNATSLNEKGPCPQLRRWLSKFEALWAAYKARESEDVARPSYRDEVIRPLADFLNKHCFRGKAKVELYGPQGICARHTIDFTYRGRVYSLGLEQETRHEDRMLSIRRFDSAATGTFRSDSIGAINGMNYPLTLVDRCYPAKWWRSRMWVYKAR